MRVSQLAILAAAFASSSALPANKRVASPNAAPAPAAVEARTDYGDYGDYGGMSPSNSCS